MMDGSKPSDSTTYITETPDRSIIDPVYLSSLSKLAGATGSVSVGKIAGYLLIS